MFYPDIVLRNRNCLGVFWLAAHAPKFLKKSDYLRADVSYSSENLMSIVNNVGERGHVVVKFSLRCSSHMMYGMLVVAKKQYEYLMDDVKRLFFELGKPARPLDLERPATERKRQNRKRRLTLTGIEEDDDENMGKMRNVVDVIEKVVAGKLVPEGFSDNFDFTQRVLGTIDNGESVPPRDNRSLTLPEADELAKPEELYITNLEPDIGFMTDAEVDAFINGIREGATADVSATMSSLVAEGRSKCPPEHRPVEAMVDPIASKFQSPARPFPDNIDGTGHSAIDAERPAGWSSIFDDPSDMPGSSERHRTPRKRNSKDGLPVVTVTNLDHEIVPPRKKKQPPRVVRGPGIKPKKITDDEMKANIRNHDALTIENCVNPKWQKIINVRQFKSGLDLLDHPFRPESRDIIDILRQKQRRIPGLHPKDLGVDALEDSETSESSVFLDRPAASSTPFAEPITPAIPLSKIRRVKSSRLSLVPPEGESLRYLEVTEELEVQHITPTTTQRSIDIKACDKNDVQMSLEEVRPVPNVQQPDQRQQRQSLESLSTSVGDCRPTGYSLDSSMYDQIHVQPFKIDLQATEDKVNEAIDIAENAKTTFRSICPPATTTRRQAARTIFDLLHLHKAETFVLKQEEQMGDITIVRNE